MEGDAKMTWQAILKGRYGKIKQAIEDKVIVDVLSIEKTKRHDRIHLRNPKTGTTRFVTTSSSPKVKGKFHLIVRDVKRVFRDAGEELDKR